MRYLPTKDELSELRQERERAHLLLQSLWDSLPILSTGSELCYFRLVDIPTDFGYFHELAWNRTFTQMDYDNVERGYVVGWEDAMFYT
jgi:hypothetical protein